MYATIPVDIPVNEVTPLIRPYPDYTSIKLNVIRPTSVPTQS